MSLRDLSVDLATDWRTERLTARGLKFDDVRTLARSRARPMRGASFDTVSRRMRTNDVNIMAIDICYCGITGNFSRVEHDNLYSPITSVSKNR